MYTFGEALIHDDAGDLGYTSYKGRANHVYHGKRSPNHPSPAHHWQIGTVLCIFSQFLALSTVAAEAQAISDEIQES